MSYRFSLFNRKKNKSEDNKSEDNKDEITDVQYENMDILSSGLPIMSKDGYFWDMHKHKETGVLISSFLPHNHEHMCHLELYSYLKKSGITNHVCIDNFVCKYVKKYPEKTRIFLDMAQSANKYVYSGMTRKDVYNPCTLIEPEKVYESLVRNNIDGLIDGVVNDKFKNDKDIVETLGFSVYQHIKYHLSQFEKVDIVDVKEQYTTDNDIIHIFEVLYPNKTIHSGTYLFHGSSYHNWYSIMLNGLKVPRSSSDVINGQVHGMAIYTGTSAATSYQYSNSNSNNYGYVIMGIVQTGDRYDYSSSDMKTFVNDDDVTLRYLIITKRNRLTTDLINTVNEIAKKFPHNQTNYKQDDELFEITEIDTDNIMKIDEVVDTRPYIELEDGTRLYDQPDLVETYIEANKPEEDDMYMNDINRFINEPKPKFNFQPLIENYYNSLTSDNSRYYD